MKRLDTYIRKQPLDCALHFVAMLAATTLAGFINWPRTFAGELTIAVISSTVMTITLSSLIRAVLKQGKDA